MIDIFTISKAEQEHLDKTGQRIFVNCTSLADLQKEKPLHHKFVSHSDEQHGWLAVKRNLLKYYEIADKVSDYSYQNGQSVYLEEDADVGLLINAIKASGNTYEIRHSSTNASRIRKFSYYVA